MIALMLSETAEQLIQDTRRKNAVPPEPAKRMTFPTVFSVPGF